MTHCELWYKLVTWDKSTANLLIKHLRDKHITDCTVLRTVVEVDGSCLTQCGRWLDGVVVRALDPEIVSSTPGHRISR